MSARDLAARRPLPAATKAALALEVLVAYARARWWLRRGGLRETVSALRSARPRPRPEDALASGRRLARVVRRTLAPLPSDTRCLAQSLTLTRMLAARGIESRLVIGVRPGERFAAHAWVEYDGVALLPAGEGGFEELVTL
jgi:hypothetical protein